MDILGCLACLLRVTGPKSISLRGRDLQKSVWAARRFGCGKLPTVVTSQLVAATGEEVAFRSRGMFEYLRADPNTVETRRVCCGASEKDCDE